MYTNISQYFNKIFPLNQATLDCLEQTFTGCTNILDLACGDGKYAIAMTNKSRKIIGADVDEAMIAIAQGQGTATDFCVCDFLHLNQHFTVAQFDGIFCIGNSLAHVKDTNELASVFEQMYHILQVTGKLLIQIINYNRIFEQNITALPVIQHDELTFERLYHHQYPHIDFHTKLFVNDDLIQEQHQLLYGITKEQLLEAAQTCGFHVTNLYGTFTQTAWDKDSFHSIFVFEK